MNPASIHRPKILGIGAGGHCRVLMDLIRKTGAWDIHGLLDQDPARGGTDLDGVPILGNDSLAADLLSARIRHAFLGIGSIGDSSLRVKIHDQLTSLGFAFPALVHPGALLAGHAIIGDATCVMPGAIVNAGAVIGVAAIINTGAIIEHDCQIGDFGHISPGAMLGGGVRVGRGSHVGIGAIVRQGIHIGRDAMVGAGAVVVQDVEDGSTVIGVPARISHKH